MIRNIRIRQWRSYDDATIDLDHPVVFFVAENGVGKSSFFEAARCCLLGFPNGRAAARAVRANADRAELSMELALGVDDIINVTRTLTRTGRATFSASRNGVTLDENTYLSTLQTTWAADGSLIDRLMFGDPGASRSNAPLPIRDHLAELLGVTPMLDAAATLRLAQADAHSRVATAREAVNASADQVAAQEAAVDDAREVLGAIVAERDAARADITAAEAAATLAAQWEKFRADAATYRRQVDELTAEIGRAVRDEAQAAPPSLDEARLEAEADLSAARSASAEADLSAARAATGAELLASPTNTCPTCLRPLDEHERLAALTAHGETVARSRTDNDRAATLITQAQKRLQTIAEFTRRLDRLHAPVEPTDPDPGPDAAAILERLRLRDRELAERLGEARAHLEAAETTLAEARANANEAVRLGQAAREELLLETTAAMLEHIADRYLSERIEPLTEDVAFRWKLLFGTEGLTLGPGGEITLRRGNVDLEMQDMSGGERAIANVIVRLLVSAATTRLPSVWFDEPLEHLDPRRRAGVAASLLQAVVAGTVPQVVVTTYEEGIARRLALAAPKVAAVVFAEAPEVEQQFPR